MKSEHIIFPKKIKSVNEEIADLKKEIDTLKLAKKEAHEEFDRLHNECSDLSHSMTERFKAENKTLYKLKNSIDPSLRPHLISLDDAKTAMVKEQKKRFNSLILLENAISVDEKKKNTIKFLADIEKMEKDASLIAKLTNISFDDPVGIGNWYKDIADDSHRVQLLSKRLERKLKKKNKLYHESKKSLEQIYFENRNKITKKISEIKCKLCGQNETLNKLKEDVYNKKILSENINSIFVSWLEKFTNYLELPIS